MNQNQLINEINSMQKHQENPRVILANGQDIIKVDYSSSEHVIVLYTSNDIASDQVANVPDSSDHLTMPAPEANAADNNAQVVTPGPNGISDTDFKLDV